MHFFRKSVVACAPFPVNPLRIFEPEQARQVRKRDLLIRIEQESRTGESLVPERLTIGVVNAAGVPFLDRAVGQGRVLYLAFEDGIVQVDQMIDQLTRHLGLQSAPQDFLTWNVNDCSPGSDTGNAALGMIRDLKPSLAIIDSLGWCF